jgi:hypothetical protein
LSIRPLPAPWQAATRVSITIPDDLAERLEPYRDRMNISKVCSEAIERELSTLVELPVEVQKLTATIAELRMEKAELEQDDYNIGLDWGQRYAEEKARLMEFTLYETIHDSIDHITFDKLPEDVRDNFIYSQNDAPGEFVYNPEKFAQGWLDGLMAVWKVIKDKV